MGRSSVVVMSYIELFIMRRDQTGTCIRPQYYPPTFMSGATRNKRSKRKNNSRYFTPSILVLRGISRNNANHDALVLDAALPGSLGHQILSLALSFDCVYICYMVALECSRQSLPPPTRSELRKALLSTRPEVFVYH